jgi:hypothetical protein
MRSNFTFQNWLEHLHYIIPLEGIVYVGAGTGASIVNYINDSVKTAVLIEADESYYAKLSQLANQHKEWSVYTAMVTDKTEEAIYYRVSNLNESSSLNPEGLSKIWRNLKTIEERPIITTSLADLLVATGCQPHNLNWLVIDCLPALPILQGAGQYKTSWDVISARVLLDETICPGQGASKSELDAYLTELGYRCLVIEEERQPALVNVLYVRDWKLCQNKALANIELNKQLSQACDEQNKLIDELQNQNQQLTAAQDEQVKLLSQSSDQHSKLVDELQAQIQQLTQARDQQLTQARDQQTKLVNELQTQAQQLTAAKDEQAKQSTQQVELVKQLTQARDQQIKLVNELQTQIQQVTVAKDEQNKQSTQQDEQVKQLTQARDQQTKLAEERLKQFDDSQKHVQQLEAQNIELATRQTLLQNEIVRAEAQIDLIKDVLLREAGL